MDELIKDLILQMNKRFDNIDKRFNEIDNKFDEIDKKFDVIDKRFNEIDKRFDLVDKQFKEHGLILRALEEKTTILVSDVDHIKHDIIDMEDSFVTKKSLLESLQ